MMTKRHSFLLLTLLFTLLFIGLVTAGSYLLSVESRQFAIAAFLFAFGAVFGQIASLAFFLRETARNRAIRAALNEQEQENV